eukprot:8684352-Prorocentrum_lima.AAC.1
MSLAQSDWFDDIVKDEEKATPRERHAASRSREKHDFPKALKGLKAHPNATGLKSDSLERIIKAAVRVLAPEDSAERVTDVSASSLPRDSRKRAKSGASTSRDSAEKSSAD